MNERETQIRRRYDQARDVGAISADDRYVDMEAAATELASLVETYEEDIELVDGEFKPRRTSQLTTAAFLGLAFEGASDQELAEFVRERQLSERTPIEVRIEDGIRSLVKTHRRAAELRTRTSSQTELSLDEQEYRSVDDALFDILETGRVEKQQLGAIRLLLGTIDVSDRLAPMAIDRLKASAAGDLRAGLQRTDFSHSVRAKEGESLILRIVNRTRSGYHTMQSLADLFAKDKESRSKGSYGSDPAQNRRLIETYLSEALDAMYPEA